jgi:pyrroloquinoline quinone biosynthesis protein B
MHVRLLGTAAGGGFPQWNCGCPNCRAVRSGAAVPAPRTQASIAISADGRAWFLVGASPDIRSQIESFPPLRGDPVVRGSAVEGVLLAGADLDHVLGLFLLREGERLCVHATAATRRALCDGIRLDSVLGFYTHLEWREPPTLPGPLRLGDSVPSGLLYTAFPVPGKPPRYREWEVAPEPGDCVGYRFDDPATGGRLAVLPGAAALDTSLLDRLRDCDVLLIDGTFWSEHELAALGTGAAPASAMGHLPVGGVGGSLELVAGLPALRKIYIHINNTNPILIDGSPERREVEAHRVEIGYDGLAFDI